jgi:Flp pilus assembly pilin Flp
MVRIVACFRAFLRDDRGQDLIEYALIASLIVIAAIVVVGDAGTEVARLWNNIVEGIPPIP